MSAALDITATEPQTTKAAEMISALPESPTWDDILSVIDEFIPALAQHARSEQASGTAASEFVEGLSEVARDWRTSDGLKKIFAAPGDLNLTQDEIEYALDELKAGSDPDAVLACIEGARSAGSSAAWEKAVISCQEALALREAANEAASLAYDLVIEECPVPPELQNRCSESAIEHSSLPTRERMRLLEKLDAWKIERTRAEERHRHTELDAKADALAAQHDEAEDRLMRMQPPHWAGLTLQLRQTLILDTDIDPDTAAGMSTILGSKNHNYIGSVYVHAVRLAGLPREEGWGEEFDPAAWVEEFEALPGHSMRPTDVERYRADPHYDDPVAWGPDMPAPNDLMITDPVAIARYDAWARAQFTDAQWESAMHEGSALLRNGAPYLACCETHITGAYPDENDPDRLRLLDILEMRHQQATDTRKPLGAEMWSALEKWQRDLVMAHVVENAARFPENRIWTAEEWLKAFEHVGGTSIAQDNGDVLFGAPCPPTPAQRRLLAVCEAQTGGFSSSSVKKLVRARTERIDAALREVGVL